ncbi:MAG TPA: FG-GAP-like repeat-containing protein [Pyrinomonadaceae bacterium]|jgi:tetratricopeptide (TPR) repeat protein|nr:FG-GAP-like repeat-containing protein [Pyrinomonadaceae bacterium]
MRLPNHYRPAALLFILAAIITVVTGCRRAAQLPDKSSREYADVVRAFYVGLAALQVGDDVRADARLAEVTRLVAGEPAGWGNWGLLALRQRNFDDAAQRLERARSLAPESDQIHYLIGLLESGRGRPAESAAALRRAVELNPRNLVAAYKLAEEVERQGDENSGAESQRLVEKILEAQPDNLAALLELARVSAKRGDADTLRRAVERISARAPGWPPEVQQQLSAVQSAAAGADIRGAATRIAFLRNVLVRVAEFRRGLAAIKPPPGEEAEPFTKFLRLETPTFAPAPADTALSFSPEQLAGEAGGARWNWIGALSLDGEGSPCVVEANGREVRLTTGAAFPFPGGAAAAGPLPEGVAALDFDYDFKNDLALAGAGGVRLMRQDAADAFTDVTAQTKLPASTVNAAYLGSWAADIDADGDLDIVLGAAQGAPLVLRNNGDGTFAEARPFANVSGLRAFAWADLDADGDPDAALTDGDGKLHVFANERAGQFNERPLPPDFPSAPAISAADVNSDGVIDLLVARADGVIVRLSDRDEGRAWDAAEVARVGNAPNHLEGELRLRAADLDNNGGLDLLLTSTPPNGLGTLVWLGDGRGSFKPLGKPVELVSISDAADLDGDGRLDLLGLSADGRPLRALNRGAKNYHWQRVRPRAAKAVGDQRINSFGVGGEMEIRAGLLVQKQLMTGPLVHFGLGEQSGADVVRIVWPNGSVRAEFDLKADETIAAEQRLKGSCPFLFADDGRGMKFVKDAVPWGSAIGLRINTLGTARVEATEEWYKIGRDQLAPRDGSYDLRLTAELWETYYYDRLALMTVDHPAGTEVFVDERFSIPPVKLAVTAVETPRRVARASDDQGRDVTGVVGALDEKYLDTFGRGRYQGVARDHFVEVDLGDDAPREGPLYLIAQGWMHPTDSSINVAISQGRDVSARPLSLEVPDGRGGWVVAAPNLGFPAGRKKICLFDLSRVFRPGTPRRLRLRTNLEIFWDSIEWARGLPDAQLKTIRLDPRTADLRYRGYSVIARPDDSSPEVPDYQRLAASKQVWRDLVGYYTRFGDVRELLSRADDRYVIMNAGDEMAVRFDAPPAPPAGWVRDFVIAGDGWIKDGDFNSTFSKTVLPLPYHERREYTSPPGRLEDEEVYRRHPEDWQTYHTRYVTPDIFQHALRPRQRR